MAIEENSQRNYEKRILLTGGAGFIGSSVLEYLVIKYPNYMMVCYDCLTYCSSLKNIEPLNKFPNFKFIKGDVKDKDLLEQTLIDEDIDSIIHFAAESDVDKSFIQPYEYFTTNILGVLNILELMKKYKHRLAKFVHISTDEVYGENALVSVDETSSLQPTNPYAASKASADLIIHSYIKSFHIPVVIIRSNNVFGPRQYPEKIISYFSLLLVQNQKMNLQGDGSNRRRYLYITDCVNAVITLFHLGKVGEIYNIGLGTEKSNLEVCYSLLKEYSGESKIDEELLKSHIEFLPDRPFNDLDYDISCEKLSQLGWSPKKDFELAIKETMDWYKAHGATWWDTIGSKVRHNR